MIHSPNHTQRTAILNLLQVAEPGWVPAPALAKISLQYSARIFELRREGWTISNRVTTVNGKKHGSFRLGPPETPRSAELRAHTTQPIASGKSLNVPAATSELLFAQTSLYRDPEEGGWR